MYEKLKQLYPNMILLTPNLHISIDQYYWFKTDDPYIVGFLRQNLSEQEYNLLSAFLEPYELDRSGLSTREQLWHEWIYHQGEENLPSIRETFPYQYRYIFFSLRGDEVDYEAFYEAIQSMFPHKMPLLWENDHQGFIIEERFENKEEEVSFEQIIDVLMSDFYIRLQLYISPYYSSKSYIQKGFTWGSRCFQLSSFIAKPVVTYQEIMPLIYTNSLNQIDREYIHHTILHSVMDEPDLLHTIQTFLECNSNATSAAKQLFMHRNSLQYRVDKFTEKTGIDVKQFHGAIITYLAILQVRDAL
ncbi:PucR family transcriptional regulator [Pontibacillus salicampi]|uniref:PucR family transcriptional regulator n=1 Tax=Pontibacillus salicampi TaxID=1449801 RepID=A0ABV6LM60_9BACI